MTTSVNYRNAGARLPLPGGLAAALCAGSVLLGGAAAAQEVVALSPEVHVYNSPLVLEYSLDDTIRSPVPATTTRLAEHSCRGVTIETLVLQLLRVAPDQFLSLKGAFTLFNNSGKDKKADMLFELLVDRSDEVLASLSLKKVDAEAGKSGDGKLKIPVPTSLIPVDANPSDPAPGRHLRLRITMALRDA